MFLIKQFSLFNPKWSIFGNFRGRYRAHLELNVYSWAWTMLPIILDIVFRWFTCFGLLSSSSWTQVTTVWSLGDDGATNHHCQHRHGHQLQTAVTWVLDELGRNTKKGKSSICNIQDDGHLSCTRFVTGRLYSDLKNCQNCRFGVKAVKIREPVKNVLADFVR